MIRSLRHAINASVTALNEKRVADAVKICEKAIKRYGSNLVLLNEYGRALQEQGKYAQAAAQYRRALMYMNPRETKTAEALVRTNLAKCLWALHDHNAAAEQASLAMFLDARHAKTQEIYGVIKQENNELDEAICAYDKAVHADPSGAECGVNRAFCHLLMGNYEQGWRDYNARWFTPDHAEFHKAMSKEGRWAGENLDGKTIFLWNEQGLGDTIMFARYIPALEAMGANVLLQCQKEARPLFEVTQVDSMEGEVTTNYHAPLGDLPRLLKTHSDADIPAPARIRADAANDAAWRAWMSSGRRVGVAWSGNPRHKNDHNRSIRLANFWGAFAPLEEEVHFYALQRDCNPADRDALYDSEIVNFGERIQSLADVASIVANVDLVVTVDTAHAHLSGSMGKPTILLLPFHPDWRWGLERETTSWYPSIKIIRQHARGDWTQALARVTEILKGA